MTTNVIDYADPAVPRTARRLWQASVWCAVLPMSIGASILAFYWLTDWHWLVNAGLIMLPVGAITVLVGFIFVITYAAKQSRIVRPEQRSAVRWRARRLGLLLLANFPMAGLCALAGATLANRCIAIVENQTNQTMESFVLSWPGGSKEVGPIRPGRTVRCIIPVREQPVDFKMMQNGVASSGPLDVYWSDGTRAKITISSSGWTVKEVR